MAVSCDLPIFGKGKGLVVIGHCALSPGHTGQCAMMVETKKQDDNTSDDEQKEFDFTDLYENWRPIRDIGDGSETTIIFPTNDEV